MKKTKITLYEEDKNMGESFPSPDGIPSRQSRLGPFLWFVQNRWEKFWGIIGGGLAVGLQSRWGLVGQVLSCSQGMQADTSRI